MRKLLATATIVGIGLILPAGTASAAKPTVVKPAKVCAAEKRADREAFKETYGKRAMRTCMKGVREDVRNAAKDCKEERAADPDAFKETWGTGPRGKNALGKCVSASVKDDGHDEEDANSKGKGKK